MKLTNAYNTNYRYRYIFVALICLVVAVIVYVLVTRSTASPAPYPPVEKQRTLLASKPNVIPIRLLDSNSIIGNLRYLASDTCEGRGPGSQGHLFAVNRIVNKMRQAGLDSFGQSYIHTFAVEDPFSEISGQNIIGYVRGHQDPEKFIVISAHYDHLGRKGSAVYYGASDNASGVACLLALANYFVQHPQRYSLIFAAFDMEESGMEGSLHFVDHLPGSLQLQDIKLNLNFDMIARNDNNELFVCGLSRFPSLAPAIKDAQDKTNCKILMGHDVGNGRSNWINQSDQYAFYLKGIPFLYIGAEDNADYHKPTDTYDKFDLSSYIENCNMTMSLIKSLNERLQ